MTLSIKSKATITGGFFFALLCFAAEAQQAGTTQTPSTQTSTVTLRIKTDVAGAQVFLDNQDVGRTPLTLQSVSTGTHRLTVIKEGFDDHVQEIEALPGKTSSLFIVLKPHETLLPQLPAHFKVVHQHQSGGCLGDITVTAESLEFKAENNQHIFHLPLRDIKTVSRSFGQSLILPIPAGSTGSYDIFMVVVVGKLGGGKIPIPRGLIPLRVDSKKGGYGFWAYDENQNADKPDPERKEALVITNAEGRTRELFEVAYRLWTGDVSARSKAKEKK